MPKHSPPRKPDWTRPLLHPLTIPGVMRLDTVGDVRTLIQKHLLAEVRQKETWRNVAVKVDEAARGADTFHVVIALRLVLTLEGVEWNTK
jgi:hypothetical protein